MFLLKILLAACTLLIAASPATAQAPLSAQRYIPAEDAFIKSYINRYQSGLVNLSRDKHQLIAFIEAALVSKGIPKELKNLAVIESYLDNRQVSHAGAAGPWQLMPATAREYGLHLTPIDERYDIYKSTLAAVHLLKDLYSRYHDWSLAVAAYNGGIGRVNAALQARSGTAFNDIEGHLPRETRLHVKKFMAASYVLDGGTPVTPLPLDRTAPDSVMLARKGFCVQYITAGYTCTAIEQRLSMTPGSIEKLNPQLDRETADKGFFRLILPLDKAPDFQLYRTEILQASIAQRMGIEATTPIAANRNP